MPPNNNHFVSWSGGKDCCLALHRTMQDYGNPACLLNMMTEDNYRSRSHGLSRDVLTLQAQSLAIPISFYPTDWDNYETVFLDALHEFKNQGITFGVFGDIKIPDDPNWNTHRQWADHICQLATMHAKQPLWGESSEEIVHHFIHAGFTAVIIAVNTTKLAPDYLGRNLTFDLINEFKSLGIDPAGERGEYHTIVIDGPIFSFPLQLEEGERVLKNSYWFLDLKKAD